MKQLRLFALLLLVLCLAFALVACGDGNDGEPNDDHTKDDDTAQDGGDDTTQGGGDNNGGEATAQLAYQVNSDGETCTVTGLGDCTDTALEIPAEIDGYTVTAIGTAAFRDHITLTSVSLPEGVTSVGAAAFQGCLVLEEITLPTTVASLGGGAFRDCYALADLHYLGTPAEWGRVEKGTAWNTGTGSFTVYFGPNKQTTLTDLEYTVKRDGTTCTITGKGTCTDTALIIPSEVDGYTVTAIGSSAFSGYTELKSITIPDSVTSIGSSAFEGCTGLTSVAVGKGVTSIDDGAFSNCTSLASITVAQGNTKYHSAGNCLIETATKTLIQGCKSSVIPTDGSVTGIGDYAFENCTGLTSITIPGTVNSIGGDRTYEGRAFSGCTGLTSVTIGNGVNSIGYRAFYGCTGLKSISIPSSVTSIGDSAFYDCTGLTGITIPSGVAKIDSHAFSGCTGLKSIVIPNSVTEIGTAVLSGCTGLTSMTIPFVDATSNGTGTHFGYFFTISYKNADIPASLRTVIITGGSTIVSHAFYGCENITSITISDSVTSIGDSAFEDCRGLTHIYCEASSQPSGWDSGWKNGCSAQVVWGYTG